MLKRQGQVRLGLTESKRLKQRAHDDFSNAQRIVWPYFWSIVERSIIFIRYLPKLIS